MSPRSLSALVTVMSGVVLLALAVLAAESAVLAVAAAIFVLVVGLVLYDPLLVPVLAMPALVVIERVGGGGIDLSMSDFALFGAFWVALVFAPRPFSPAMRSLLWLSAWYQAATLFTVVVNPYLANTVEWFHAWLSVGGALVVGWAVGRSGRGGLGLVLLLVPCLAIALQTVVIGVGQLAAGDTGPVYINGPVAMHKNFIGGILGVAALVAYVRPVWAQWPRWWAMLCFWLCTAGVVASQARQALVGLAVGILLVSLRKDPDRRRSKLVLLAVVPAVYFVVLAVQEQLTSDNVHNSANQRLTWYGDALDVWERNPWFGMGLRWWTSGRTEFVFQPPNAELEVLSSTGVVGLVAFLALFVGGLVALWRVDPRYGTLALAILLMRLVTGQFDLFWVAVQVSVPFVVIGVALGAEAHARAVGASTRRDELDRPGVFARTAPAVPTVPN